MNFSDVEHLRCPYCCRVEGTEANLDYRGTNLELELMDGVLICHSCCVAWGVEDGWIRLTREDRSPYVSRLRRGLANKAPKWHDMALKAVGRSPCAMLDSAVQALRLDQIQASDEPVRILELGCGSGLNLPAIYASAPANTQVWATDLAVGLLHRARRKVENEPELAETRLLMADPHKLPFDAETFDRVIYVGELSDFRDPNQVCAEMLRVVKPDGVVFPA